jgi:hypothetical protein
MRRGDPSGALALVNPSIDLVGLNPELLDTRAVVLTARGDTKAAIRDLDEALAAGPSATRYFHLAQARWKVHDRRAAADAFRRATSLGLNAESLHFLERPAYSRLLDAIGIAPTQETPAL